MCYKSYTQNLVAIKVFSYVFLVLKGKAIASFVSIEDCDNFVAEFMR